MGEKAIILPQAFTNEKELRKVMEWMINLELEKFHPCTSSHLSVTQCKHPSQGSLYAAKGAPWTYVQESDTWHRQTSAV